MMSIKKENFYKDLIRRKTFTPIVWETYLVAIVGLYFSEVIFFCGNTINSFNINRLKMRNVTIKPIPAPVNLSAIYLQFSVL